MRSGRRSSGDTACTPGAVARSTFSLFSRALGALALGALAGCSAASLTLDLELPPLPPEWEAAYGSVDCEVSYREPSGSDATIRVSPWCAGAAGLELELSPGAYASVLATPVAVSTGSRLRPAGAVFPLDSDRVRIAASWEQGCAAWVLARLLEKTARSCLEPEDLDFERIARLIADRGGEDPWWVDTAALLDSLADPEADAPVCRLLPSRMVTIPAAELPGTAAAPVYVLDDALFPPVLRGSDEAELSIGALPRGFHRLFASDPIAGPAGSWLDILVTEREAAWIEREVRPIPSAP